MIRKVDGGYVVVSHKGKRLSKPASKEAAVKRLRQIEYFKHHNESINTMFPNIVGGLIKVPPKTPMQAKAIQFYDATGRFKGWAQRQGNTAQFYTASGRFKGSVKLQGDNELESMDINTKFSNLLEDGEKKSWSVTDPQTVTNYNRSHPEKEEFLVFTASVAGKNATTTAKGLNKFYDKAREHVVNKKLSAMHPDLAQSHGEHVKKEVHGMSPFELIRNVGDHSTLANMAKESGLGCHNARAKSMLHMANSGMNLHTATVDDLHTIPGIGPKSARFFLLHSRPDQQHAVLDTHILGWMRDQGINAPKSTPQSPKKYGELEKQFLSHAAKSGKTPADFDLDIWKERSNKKKSQVAESRVTFGF